MQGMGSGGLGWRSYQGEVHEDLHAVAWSHVGHVVEVGWVGDHPGTKLRVPQHLPDTQTHTCCWLSQSGAWRAESVCPALICHLLCCSRSSSGTLKRNFLLLRVRTINFLLWSDVSGMVRSPSVCGEPMSR